MDPRRLCLHVALAVATAALLGACTRPVGPDQVARVVDGDTIVVGSTTVRLIGIDAPETKHPRRAVGCFGREAARRLGGLLPRGTPVALEFDVERTDHYGRTLAYVWRRSDGLLVNQDMVAGGHATVFTVPPNVARQDAFLAAERAAREQRRGLWSACR